MDGCVMEQFGAAIMVGGKYKDGQPLCDIWVLDLDAVVYFVENPGSELTNFWTKREVSDEQLPLLCRYGHSVEVIDYQNILIYGGIDSDNYAMRQPLVYNFVTQELTEFEEEGDAPPTRIGFDLLPIGGGMMILYGGADPSGQGSYSDLWHLRVHMSERHIHFYEALYKDDHEHYILSWRSDYSFEFLPGIDDPVIIGGHYGNGQYTNVMMTVPETICTNMQEFAQGQCIPCP